MSKNKKIDFLIVGQGLAGSLIAYFLMKAGKQVAIFDDNHKTSSSKAAAGIINPITGRRFVKSWMFEELQAFNESFYSNLEKEFDVTVYSKRKVLRFLQKNKDINEWHTRRTFEGYEKFMVSNAKWKFLKGKINEPEGFGEIDFAAQLKMPLLLKTFQNSFKNENILNVQNIDYDKFIINDGSITFDGLIAEKIIFCEGQKGRFNPFFSYLPFEVSKGEILIARIPDLKSEKIIKDKLIIAPLGDDLYWCGSNYEWNATDELPTDSIREDFIKKLQQTLKVKFEIVEHIAAIRPTVKDRRPFLGIHPQYPQMAIFNGLGTKGASLGPFWAKHFVDFLTNDIQINPEVNINRFDFN